MSTANHEESAESLAAKDRIEQRQADKEAAAKKKRAAAAKKRAAAAKKKAAAAKKKAAEEKKRADAAPPEVEESYEDQLAGDELLDQELGLEAELSEEVPSDSEEDVFRPSDLEVLILESVGGDEEAARAVDRCKFLREEGLPSPRRRYRVSASRGSKDGPIKAKPLELNATDEADAIRLAGDIGRIKYSERHRWRFVCVVLEE